MRRIRWLMALALLVAPEVSHAIQLHWWSGATNLDFTAATRCTLVVQADSGETVLPAEARLLWVADTTSITFVALDSLTACETDTAEVSRIDGPETPADSSANLITAHFCSTAQNGPPTARYVMDVPGGARGKLKAVALDPTDSTQVIESNEVTFNGGVEGAFPPTLLAAWSLHQSTELSVRATGSDLSGTQSAVLTAPDGSWTVPLEVTERTGSTLAVTADVPAVMPASVLSVSTPAGAIASADVPPDAITAPDAIPPVAMYVDSSTYVTPKDFAFFYDGRGYFHLFYLRHNRYQSNPDSDATKFCHVWSNDLYHWSKQDTTSFRVSPVGWDKYQVWAPSLVQQGPTYYMFYVGIDSLGNQRIGVAWTDNILTSTITWNRRGSPLFAANMTAWADVSQPQQFRDPFVMPDPFEAGHWLLYYVATIGGSAPNMAVGVARSQGTSLLQWTDYGPLLETDWLHAYKPTVESPHVFQHTNALGDSTWYVFFTAGPSGPADTTTIRFETNKHSPIDTSQVFGSNNWTSIERLFWYLNHDVNVAWWEGTEYLKVCNSEFLAGYNWGTVANWDSNRVWIRQMSWTPGVGGAPDKFSLGAGSVAGVEDRVDGEASGTTALVIAGSNPARSGCRFSVVVPRAMRARLDIFDLAGRRVKTMFDERVPAGRTSVRWDGLDAAGVRAGSGLYFARLSCGREHRVARVVLIR